LKREGEYGWNYSLPVLWSACPKVL
jgi:hypothetical protein